MQPCYRVLADSKDVTAALSARLISISVTDEIGRDSDMLDITLDDRGGVIGIPHKGELLSVSMGYKESGLSPMGSFVVDETTMSGFPQTMIIRAKSADMQQSLKAPIIRSFDGLTIGSICSTIAKKHGYSASISPELANVSIPHIDQTESDLNFLTRLAADRGAIIKFSEKKLLFFPTAQEKTMSGKTLPTTQLTLQQLTRYEMVQADRGLYSSVSARYWDHSLGKEIPITVGQGDTVYSITRTYSDLSAATAAAKAQLQNFNLGYSTLTLECIGNAALMAGSFINLAGVRTGVNGEWYAQQASHHIDNRGYHCQVSARTLDSGEAEG